MVLLLPRSNHPLFEQLTLYTFVSERPRLSSLTFYREKNNKIKEKEKPYCYLYRSDYVHAFFILIYVQVNWMLRGFFFFFNRQQLFSS